MGVLGNVTFEAGLTPLIFDPMSVIAFQRGSCTGLSILLVSALRSLGIPSRVVGTPAWNGKQKNGNHNWIEYYSSQHEWKFIEAAPAHGGVPDKNAPPCNNWFCDGNHFDGKTKVYAARLEKSKSESYYPLAWDFENHAVPADDRTEYMTKICSQCDM